MCCTVAQAPYDSREEKTERIGRQAQSVEAKPIKIDLWVLECLADSSPGELFVPSGVVILSESCEDVLPLLWGEEPRSCGVVMDEEVRSNGHDDSQQTLLGRCVSFNVKNRSRGIHDDEDPPPTSQTPDSSHFCKSERLKLRERYIEDET